MIVDQYADILQLGKFIAIMLAEIRRRTPALAWRRFDRAAGEHRRQIGLVAAGRNPIFVPGDLAPIHCPRIIASDFVVLDRPTVERHKFPAIKVDAVIRHEPAAPQSRRSAECPIPRNLERFVRIHRIDHAPIERRVRLPLPIAASGDQHHIDARAA